MTKSGGIELGPAHIRAFLAIAEVRHLSRFFAAAEPPAVLWPGFDPRAIPFLVYRGDGEAFLVQHPDPPPAFQALTLPVPGMEGVPLFYHRGALSFLPAVGPVEVAGRSTVTLPVSVFRKEVPPEALVSMLVHEAFHAFGSQRAGTRTPRLALLSSYPELSAVNNAFGTLEGLLLHDYLSRRLGLGGDPSREGAEPPPASSDGDGRRAGVRRAVRNDPVRAAYAFALVRRERRAPLEDEIIDYERSLEGSEGIARYVQVKSLLLAAPDNDGLGGYSASTAFETLAGRRAYSRAPELIAEHVGKLCHLNVNAAGAAWWRFFHSGMGLALFADDLDADWKRKVVEGLSLDDVIEQGVSFDGEAGDERELELVKKTYDFDARLDAERVFSRAEEKRKRKLLAALLAGSGTRLTFDVSSLIAEETWWESGRFRMHWDPASVETITRNVRIHRRGLRFVGFGTDLRFEELPVVEDLKHRLFHVSVPATRLGVRGDGRDHSPVRPAAFEQGLEVVLPGVVARATSGYVQDTGSTLYIKITR